MTECASQRRRHSMRGTRAVPAPAEHASRLNVCDAVRDAVAGPPFDRRIRNHTVERVLVVAARSKRVPGRPRCNRRFARQDRRYDVGPQWRRQFDDAVHRRRHGNDAVGSRTCAAVTPRDAHLAIGRPAQPICLSSAPVTTASRPALSAARVRQELERVNRQSLHA